MGGVVLAAVTGAPLDADAHLALVRDERAGAVASFFGQSRDHDPEARGEVTGIEYTHHPDAATILHTLVAGAVADLDADGVATVAASHRVGTLAVGDLALVVCVSAPHRALAFALCAEVVERIKAGLPVWKRQFERDGRAVWSGLGLAPAGGGADA